MPITRQYSLPNCSLILSGIGDAMPGGNAIARPLMTTLIDVECFLVGQPQSISGGMEFLKQLISTVSNYTQRFLSGFAHPNLVEDGGLIRLEKGDSEHQHRLISKIDGKTTVWELSTVQLFDLAEAIDQFLADGMTLPDVAVAIRPAPKGSGDKLTARAAPLGLGLTGLVAAAAVFYLLPAPQKISPVTPPPVPQVQSK